MGVADYLFLNITPNPNYVISQSLTVNVKFE
jgi:hypothetical protein